MANAVVVELDRQLGALDAEHVEELGLALVRLDRGQRLGHPPEHDPPLLALEAHGNDPAQSLEADLLERERPAQNERRPERRMPGERQLGRRREDPDPRMPLVLGLVDEDGLGEVHLARDLLELVLRELARVREDRDLVALERRVREDVGDDVAEPVHDGRSCENIQRWPSRSSAR